MSKIEYGGPAFPVQDAASWQGHGMTLRDYFAAKAMQGLLGVAPPGTAVGKSYPDANINFAMAAYAIADAMLAAREGK